MGTTIEVVARWVVFIGLLLFIVLFFVGVVWLGRLILRALQDLASKIKVYFGPALGARDVKHDNSVTPAFHASSVHEPVKPSQVSREPVRRMLELSVSLERQLGTLGDVSVKVRGGSQTMRNARLVYIITIEQIEDTNVWAVGDSSSIIIPPVPFRSVYVRKDAPLDCDEWSTLKVISLDELFPAHAGTRLYRFNCSLYLTSDSPNFGSVEAVGKPLETASVIITLELPWAGYLDEGKWIQQYESALKLLSSALCDCQVKKSVKHDRILNWIKEIEVQMFAPRRRGKLQAHLREHFEQLRDNQCEPNGLAFTLGQSASVNFQCQVALLMVHVAGAEPAVSRCRAALDLILSHCSPALSLLPPSELLPLPPLPLTTAPTQPTSVKAPITASPAAVGPKQSSTLTPLLPSKVTLPILRVPFALRAERVFEGNTVIGLEVFARGSAFSEAVVERSINLRCRDAGEIAANPFLLASDDVDEVSEIFELSVKFSRSEYVVSEWNRIARIDFKLLHTPYAGSRYVALEGVLEETASQGRAQVSSPALSSHVNVEFEQTGYLRLREERLMLRKHMVGLAVGIAKFGGLETIHTQDKLHWAFLRLLAGNCRDPAERTRTIDALKGLIEAPPSGSSSYWKSKVDEMSVLLDEENSRRLISLMKALLEARKSVPPAANKLYDYCLDKFGLDNLPRRLRQSVQAVRRRELKPAARPVKVIRQVRPPAPVKPPSPAKLRAPTNPRAASKWPVPAKPPVPVKPTSFTKPIKPKQPVRSSKPRPVAAPRRRSSASAKPARAKPRKQAITQSSPATEVDYKKMPIRRLERLVGLPAGLPRAGKSKFLKEVFFNLNNSFGKVTATDERSAIQERLLQVTELYGRLKAGE